MQHLFAFPPTQGILPAKQIVWTSWSSSEFLSPEGASYTR
jgi:hypothetical protein